MMLGWAYVPHYTHLCQFNDDKSTCEEEVGGLCIDDTYCSGQRKCENVGAVIVRVQWSGGEFAVSFGRCQDPEP